MEDPADTVSVVLDAARRLDKALAAALPADLALSRSRVQSLILAGAVSVDGVAATDPGARVGPGARVALALPPPAPMAAAAEDIPLDIVFEDDHLLVVDKPAGLVVHPAPGAPDGTLVNALLHHCGDGLRGIGGVGRPGIVHRIDKDTSGLLVVAKSDLAHQGLSAQFAAHSVARLYRAVCRGVPDPASARLRGIAGVDVEPGGVIRIEAPLGRHRTDRKKMAVRADGKRAVTRLTVEDRLEGAALISCRLETGRTHQIRVHLSHIGHPLLGDPVYGGARLPPGAALPGQTLPGQAQNGLALPGQALHAATLGFRHPATDEMLSFDAAPPARFTALLEFLTSGPLKRM